MNEAEVEQARAAVHRAVVGELSADDVDVVRAFARFPELRAEFEALRQTQSILDQAGHAQRETLGLSRSIAAPELDVTAKLRALAATSSRRRGWSGWGALLAAALVVLAVAWWLRRPEPPTRPRSMLDQKQVTIDDLRCTPVAGGFRLAWRDKESAAHYKVRVIGPAPDRRSDSLDRPEWTFSAESTAAWPDSVTFEVQGYDELGRQVGGVASRAVAWPPR